MARMNAAVVTSFGEPPHYQQFEVPQPLLAARSDRSREMNWIQIGSVAGPTTELPSVALRSANFRLQGSGQGSVPAQAYLAELPSLVAEITAGTIAVKATTMPLADVEQIWTRAEVPGERTVLAP